MANASPRKAEPKTGTREFNPRTLSGLGFVEDPREALVRFGANRLLVALIRNEVTDHGHFGIIPDAASLQDTRDDSFRVGAQSIETKPVAELFPRFGQFTDLLGWRKQLFNVPVDR